MNRFKKIYTLLTVIFLVVQSLSPSMSVFASDEQNTDTALVEERVVSEEQSSMDETATIDVPSLVLEETEEMFSVFDGMSKVSYGYTDENGNKVTVQEQANDLLRATLDSSEYTPYTFRTELNGYWAEGLMPVLKMDGEVVFCIEPGVVAHEGSGYNPTELEINQKETIQDIGNFGYPKEKTHEMYYATQGYIWEVMGASFQNGYAGYGTKKKQIDNNITKYYIRPSFHGQTVTVKMGEPLTLTDTNDVLSEYVKDVSTGGVKTSVNGNKLTLTVYENTNDNALVKMWEIPHEGTSIAYIKEGSQAVAKFSVSDPAAFTLNVEAIKTGDLKIKKIDKETGEVVPKTEFDVTFGGKTQKVITDNKGEGEVKGIIHGTTVNVTETFVPAPYYIDENNTQEVIIQGGKVTPVEFQNKQVTGKSTITKTDKTTGTNEPLNPNYPLVGARYGWFKEDGKLIQECTLDDSLTATIDNQPLGNYYWLETYAPVGHTLDPTKHEVKLEYKDQYTPVVIQDADSEDDVIRMNMDGQKKVVNPTNEIYQNGVELTATNHRTQEETTVVTKTVDGKKGYLQFTDLPLDDYTITETKGVAGYENITPIDVFHTYDKETDSYTFRVIDHESGHLLNEETLTHEELAQDEHVDLGFYVLKDNGTITPESDVKIATQAHTGDGKTQAFNDGDAVPFYDDVVLTHKHVPYGTIRAFDSALVAEYTDENGKKTEKEVWTIGKIDYSVTQDEQMKRVFAEYDYRQDPKGTTYYFKERGYKKVSTAGTVDSLFGHNLLARNERSEDGRFEYVEDCTHNLDGSERTQRLVPINEEPKKLTPPTNKVVKQAFPPMVETANSFLLLGVVLLAFAEWVRVKKNNR